MLKGRVYVWAGDDDTDEALPAMVKRSMLNARPILKVAIGGQHLGLIAAEYS